VVKDTITEKMRFVIKFAEQIQAPIIQAGDLFDSPRSWSALDLAVNLLIRECKQSPDAHIDNSTKFFTVFGQHDTSMYNESTRHTTSLGILSSCDLVGVAQPDSYYDLGGSTHLYGCSYGQAPCAPRALAGTKILVVHDSIARKPEYPKQEYKEASQYLKNNPGYDLIVCGDIHQRFLWVGEDGRIILNAGPLLRLEASEAMIKHKPGFFVVDTKDSSVEWVEVPHKPASEVLSRRHLEKAQMTGAILEEFVEAVKSEEVKGTEFMENLLEFMDKAGLMPAVKDRITGLISKEK
jgi:DNA repair exonuclease SbcCD nuclease subunit